MKYDSVQANSAGQLVVALHAEHFVGWEVIAITVAPPSAYGKPPTYCAFLRRRDPVREYLTR